MKVIFFFLLSLSYLSASGITNSDEQDGLTSSGSISRIEAKAIAKDVSKLYQDVDGYEDDYLRCSICLFRFTGNTSETLSKLLVIASSVMTGVVAIPGLLSDESKIGVCAASGICQLSAIALTSFKTYSEKAIVKREEQLKEVLVAHGVIFDED